MRIFRAILRKVFQLLIVAFLVNSATFFLTSLIPGDFFTPLEGNPNISLDTVRRLREQYGLAEPTYLQYVHWLARGARFDLGYSLFYGDSVASVVSSALANTLRIGIPALIIGLLAGSFLGTLHALHQDRPLGYFLDVCSAIILSLPSLILGVAALLLAAGTHWFPVGGITSSEFANADVFTRLADQLHHLALPVLCLGLPLTATVERIQYSAARITLQGLHLRAARSRGLSSGRIFFKHLMLPSLNPVVSTAGPVMGLVLSGSLVIEMIFSWPGLGKTTYDALFNLDIFLLLGCVSCGSLLLVAGNLSADLLLQMIDPRTRT